MVDLAAHLVVFTVLGVVFLMLPLIAGLFVRPANPTKQKLTAYECGEPTIGSAFVQFDLRFYVVALLFIIFDVEVAFFFPWAAIYGGSTHLADPTISPQARQLVSEKLLNQAAGTLEAGQVISAQTAELLMTTGLIDLFVFFAVLLVGFAYVWKRGDLDWVRAMTSQVREEEDTSPLRGATLNPDPGRELEAAHH